MYLYLSVVVMLHNLLFMKYGGPVEVAAYGIASYLIGFYYLLAEGVCGGMQPLVSYYHGARQPEKVRKVLSLGLMTAVGGGSYSHWPFYSAIVICQHIYFWRQRITVGDDSWSASSPICDVS